MGQSVIIQWFMGYIVSFNHSCVNGEWVMGNGVSFMV